jgi:hypothetical protein
LTTAAILKERTVKDLGQMAKQYGVSGWHTMRKDELVRALVRACKAEAARSTRKSKTKAAPAKGDRKGVAARKSGNTKAMSSPAKASTPAKGTAAKGTAAKGTKVTLKTADKRSPKAAAPAPAPKAKSARVVRRIQQANAERERRKDLSLASYVPKVPRRNGSSTTTRNAANGKAAKNGSNGKPDKDRLVLLVRDPFWLHACWDVTRQSVQRARAAMAEHWHTARPVLRLLEVDSGTTTSSAERVVRDIEVHGGVKNWYVDVMDPPKSYRVDLGYLSNSGRFYTLARSNAVKTPQPGASDAIDENWSDVAANYEKIYAQSGGNTEETAGGELQELFEERLRRPMGSPVVTGYGVGAERTLHRHRNFEFEVDAEMIIYGSSKPDAHVTLGGEPVKLRPDGTFTVRLSMPDRRQVLPVVAASADGVEQRTIVLAVERNTKVMEPMIREANE